MTILSAAFLFWACWQVRFWGLGWRGMRGVEGVGRRRITVIKMIHSTRAVGVLARLPIHNVITIASTDDVPAHKPRPGPRARVPMQLYDCLRKGQIEQHPLFSFTASQNAAAAAAAGRNMEAGLTGPAAPYGASPYGGAVGGGAAPYGAGGGGGAPSYQFYPPNGVPGGRPAQQPRAPIF
jgi:hypothetical protein